MDKKANIVAIVPARGGSKGIPRKNIKLLCGLPMIAYTIKVALASKYIGRVIVSTEDRDIAGIARVFGSEVIPRPEDLAQDDTPTIKVCQHVINYLEETENFRPDIIVLLQPTSPLREVRDIDGAIESFLQGNCDSVVTVCETEHPPQWMYILQGDKLKPLINAGRRTTRRQDVPTTYRLNGAVYVIRKDFIMKKNSIIGENTKSYIMDGERSIDIDDELDFKMVELLLRKHEESNDRQ